MEIITDYTTYRNRYILEHPASVPEYDLVDSEYPGWVQYAALMMFLSSSLLSGVHTIPIVYRGIEQTFIDERVRSFAAHSAVVIIEFAILLSVFVMLGKRRVLGIFGFITAFAVAIGANIIGVHNAYQASGDLESIIITGLMGVVAPLTAAMSGALFVDMRRSERRLTQRAKAQYREAMQEFDAKILSAWTKYQRTTGQLVQLDTSERTASGQRTGYGHQRTADAKTLVQEHLSANPADFDLTVRELADKIGVGKTTVSDVKKAMNGHVSQTDLG